MESAFQQYTDLILARTLTQRHCECVTQKRDRLLILLDRHNFCKMTLALVKNFFVTQMPPRDLFALAKPRCERKTRLNECKLMNESRFIHGRQRVGGKFSALRRQVLCYSAQLQLSRPSRQTACTLTMDQRSCSYLPAWQWTTTTAPAQLSLTSLGLTWLRAPTP